MQRPLELNSHADFEKLSVTIILLLLSATFFTTSPLNAQPEVEWMRLYGDNQCDQFKAHIRTTDGGWAFAGRRGNLVVNNWLVKTDAEGLVQFQGEYNIDEGDGQAHDLVQTGDGGYLLAGAISFDDGVDCSAIRVDAFGDEVWGQVYGEGGSEHFNAVAGIKQDRFILAGFSSSWVDSLENGVIIIGGVSGYLVLIDGNGEVIWQDIYGGVENDCLEDVIVVEGGFAAAGRSKSFGDGSYDLWLLRVDENGEEIWSFVYGNEASESGRVLIRTEEDNGFAIAGYEKIPDPEDEDESIYCPVLLKLDENGEQEWFNRYELDGLQALIYGMARTVDNGYVLVGFSFEDDPALRSTYVLCLDENGNFMWDRSDRVQNGDSHDYYSAVIAEDGGITVAGQTFGENLEGYYQGLFTKLEPSNLPPSIITQVPEDSILNTIRNSDIAFSVEAVDPEGAELTYQWFFGEELVGEEELVVINFPETGDFRVRVDVSDGRWTTSTGWLIHVFNLIVDHFPAELEFEVVINSEIEFSITIGLEDEEPQYRWLMNGEECCEDSAFDCQFDRAGESVVQVYVMAHDLQDSIIWNVTVNDPEAVNGGFDVPAVFTVLPPTPNPFNSTTEITFLLPERMNADLSIYDIRGRLIETLVDGESEAGYHSVSWAADNAPDGLYFCRMNVGKYSQTVRLVLLR